MGLRTTVVSTSWRPPCVSRWPVWQRHRIATASTTPHKRSPSRLRQQTRDPWNLDADNDGLACEWLPNGRYEDGSVPATTTPIEPLTVDENGVLPPPDTFEGTGWWSGGPAPGERGPAVIAGHLDSYRGPAVFYRLKDLKCGDTIFVDRADGTEAMFATERIERHDKDDFPTEAVYGDTPDSQLRLITCGRQVRQAEPPYLDNVIVYAVRVGSPVPPSPLRPSGSPWPRPARRAGRPCGAACASAGARPATAVSTDWISTRYMSWR